MQSHIGIAFSLLAVCTCLHFLNAEESCIDFKECDSIPCIEINRDCDFPAGINAPAWWDFECKKHRASFWVDFLYWQANEEFLEVAFTSPHAFRNNICGISSTGGNVVDIGSNSRSDGTHIRGSSNFRPAFSLGAAWALPCHDNWDIFANYTRFHSDVTSHLSAPHDGFLYARFIHPNLISNNSASSIRAKWELDLDYIDLGIGRRSYFGTQFIVEPFFAIKVAWINQKMKEHITLNAASPSGFPSTIHLKTDNVSNAWGIGPRLGVEGSWYLNCNFSLIGRVAADILFTHYRLWLRQIAKDDTTVYVFNSNRFNYLRPELDMYVGLSYEWYRSCAGYHLEVGYDFQVWWNQNMIRWYNDITYISTPIGNLYIQGLRVSFGVDF